MSENGLTVRLSQRQPNASSKQFSLAKQAQQNITSELSKLAGVI